MKQHIYPFILSAIFVLHNMEEYIFFDRMATPPFGRRIMNRRNFLFSTIVLSIIVVLFSIFPAIFMKANIVVLFALLLNSLQHCLLSVRHKKLVAGTFTALFLMLPFSVFYFIQLCELGIITYGNFMGYLLISLVVMVISIVATLRLGDYFFSNRG